MSIGRINAFLAKYCLLLILLTPTAHASDSQKASWIVDLFQSFGSADEDIKNKVTSYSIDSWRFSARAQASLIGGGSCFFPGAALIFGAADFAALIRNAYDTSIGTGYLVNGTASHEDFATILAIWSGDIDIRQDQAQDLIDLVNFVYEDGKTSYEFLHAKVYEIYQKHGIQLISQLSPSQRAAMAARVPKSLALKVASKLTANHTGAVIAGKLSTKVAVKAAAKITAKTGSKGLLGHIPIAGMGVCAGVNSWIIDGFIDASDKYYSSLQHAARHNLDDQRPFPFIQAFIFACVGILFLSITSRKRSSSPSLKTT